MHVMSLVFIIMIDRKQIDDFLGNISRRTYSMKPGQSIIDGRSGHVIFSSVSKLLVLSTKDIFANHFIFNVLFIL